MMRLLLLALVSTIAPSSCHEWAFGACPSVRPMDNLAVDKFLGLWYVIEQFDTSSVCVNLNYTRVSDAKLRATQTFQLYLLDRVGIEHTSSYSADIDLNENELARMRIKWQRNLRGKSDHIVFDTDYTTYAGIYECQAVTRFLHRESAIILSRAPTLASEYVDRVRRLLSSYKIDTGHFDKISHQGCGYRTDTGANRTADGDPLTRTAGRDPLTTAGPGVRDGAEDAATTGIRDFTTPVSSTTQDSSSFQGNNSGSTTAKTSDGEFSNPVDVTTDETATNGGAVGSTGDAVNSTTKSVTETPINERNGRGLGGGNNNNVPNGDLPKPDENINSVDSDDSFQESFNTVRTSPQPPPGDVIDTVVRVD